jgi:hypothetical protein
MLIAGAAAFGAVTGWWVLLHGWTRRQLAGAAAILASPAAVAYAVAGRSSLFPALAGAVIGAASHASFRLALKRRQVRTGGPS